jgi:hypothetical protein
MGSVRTPLGPKGNFEPGILPQMYLEVKFNFKNIFARVWEGGGRNRFPIIFLAISGDSKHFSFKKNNNKSCPPGGRGSPILFEPQILFLLRLKTPCKISEPFDNPFWEKSNPSRGKREREDKCL